MGNPICAARCAWAAFIEAFSRTEFGMDFATWDKSVRLYLMGGLFGPFWPRKKDEHNGSSRADSSIKCRVRSFFLLKKQNRAPNKTNPKKRAPPNKSALLSPIAHPILTFDQENASIKVLRTSPRIWWTSFAHGILKKQHLNPITSVSCVFLS